MMRPLRSFSWILLLSLFAAAGFTHHSLPALFDTGSDVSITGEVTAFEFIAPHGYIHMQVIDESGDSVSWELETFPPGMLIRKGLTPDTLEPGETISAVGHPARDGRPLMRLLRITMPDGEERQIQ
ncbi:MAG: DUF6152 family protein [Candidatus Rariloculaceae bacterium]